MFGKKNPVKKRSPRFRLTGRDGALLFEGELSDLPLREEAILKKSEEFFNDPAPCYIHRGAVMSRLYMELGDALSPLEKGERGPIEAEELGEELCGYLQNGEQLASIALSLE